MGYGRINALRALEYLRPPYIIEHGFANGGTAHSTSSWFNMRIYGADNLQDGLLYRVRRREVRRTVYFSPGTDFTIWGRGAVNGTGWYYGELVESTQNNFTMGFTEVVPGTVTQSSAVLRTYIYHVRLYNPIGQLIADYGWQPAPEQNVKFAYTRLIPSVQVTISGPGPVYTSGNYIWTASASGGIGSYTYTWYRRIEHHTLDCKYETNWTQVGTGPSYSSYVHNGEYDFVVRVDVQSGNQNASAQRKVYPMYNDNIVCPTMYDESELLAIEMEAITLPAEFAIHDNYPNPFNPSTTIRYEIPEVSRVSLVVYDIVGREVQRLVDDVVEAGYHTAVWEGRNSSGSPVSSGIYIYRFTACPLSDESAADGLHYVKKMLFTK